MVAFLILGACACTFASAAQDKRKPAADLPEIKELPNPFVFLDGSTVKTRADWERRRKEIKERRQKAELAKTDWEKRKTVLARKTFDARASPYVE